MNAQTLRSPLCIFSLIIVIALSGVLLAPLTRAQTTDQAELTIRFEEPYYAVRTINQETSVDYGKNVFVSDEAAELVCDPPPGSVFPRGVTQVTCTATLDDQTAEGSFYVLVSSSSGTETDIEIYTIAQLPEEVFQAAQFSYNIELRNNGLSRATGVIVSGTLPPQLDLIRADRNCDTSDLPIISCTIPELLAGRPQAIPLDVKVKPGIRGSFLFTMAAEITGGQEDLFADNNSFTRRTDVRELAFASNTVYLPLLGR